MKMGSIQQARLEARVELGSTSLSVEQLSRISEGIIVELDRPAGDPVDFVVAGELVARGEVVVIGENFGIRLTQIVRKGS